MSFGMSGGKREREAARDRKKKEKEERLARNRALRAQGINPGDDFGSASESLPEVSLEDINITGVAPRGPKGSNGPTKLFVGGLDWNTENEQLREAFGRFGALREATVVTDRATGRSRGFGFVTYENPADAAVALRQMNGAEFDGRTLRVNPADCG
jgi:RNA recognition motif-containing protein